jgi:hypothetical protein
VLSLPEIIRRIADEADDFLALASNRAQARAGIEEQITLEYVELGPQERSAVVSRVMDILEAEGFFEGPMGGDAKAGSTDENADE